MPQLIPFFYFNQITFIVVLFGVVIFAMSNYILPAFARLQVSRLFIVKL